MLISEFALASGLSRDTVRFYVRIGLLQPEMGAKGGRRPYQLFTSKDVRAAQVIQVAQSLGMSLKEIADIAKEERDGPVSKARRIEILRGQLGVLEKKARELQALNGYLRAKLAWVDGDEVGTLAEFDQFLAIAPAK